MYQDSVLENNTKKISSSSLILIAFATAFLPRMLQSIGFPSAINFLHFLAIPSVCSLVLFTNKTRNLRQTHVSYAILVGLFFLLISVLISALFNHAGIVNAILAFFLLSEPFILLLSIVCLPAKIQVASRLRKWIVIFSCLNLALGILQGPILRLHLQNPDYVKGVFIGQGSGHVVGASVSLTFAIFYFLTAQKAFWIRLGVFLAAFIHMLYADAKQVVLIMALSAILILLTRFTEFIQFIKFLLLFAVLTTIFVLCVQNIPAFSAFKTWLRPEIYGPDGEATLLKMASIRIITGYMLSNPIHYFVGLGPGHTVGRLGGWMLNEYSDLLNPLGATIHPASKEVWDAIANSWLGDQSSFFSPLFGWAGIGGDLGLLGLISYLGLACTIWIYLCRDLSHFYLINVGVFGFVFSQMEEPGYMLFVAMLIGLRWHENELTLNKVRLLE